MQMRLLREWVGEITRQVGTQNAYKHVWQVVRAVLKKPVHKLWNAQVDETQVKKLEKVVWRFIVQQEPLTRIAGVANFCGYDFEISREVLDPRPETEMIVEHAVKVIEEKVREMKREEISILDMGTGSGCIVCSILAILSKKNIFPHALATDISPQALTIASKNAQNLQVKCNFQLSNWGSVINQTFDLITANPPYISSTASLPREVWAYDPPISLYAGPSGLEAHLTALPQLPRILNPKSTVLWEIGYNQTKIAEYAQTIFPHAQIDILEDFNNLPRMLKIQTSPPFIDNNI